MNKQGIYIIRCKKSVRTYIGSAFNLVERRKKHFGLLKRGVHFNIKLQHAFNKYGEENFSFEVLEFVPQLENESRTKFKHRLVNEKEQHYLDTFLFASEDDNRFHELGYNINRKAFSRLGAKRRKESNELQSKSMKGKISWNKGLTKETDERVKKYGERGRKVRKVKFDSGELISWNKGKKIGPNLKLREKRKLQIFDEQAKKNMSIAQQKRIERNNGVHWNTGKISKRGICIHCNNEYAVNILQQFHNDNCKLKTKAA